MKTTLKCPTGGCARQVAPTDVQEHSYIGGKLRLYEGECPEHGLFQEQENLPFQRGTIELPPTGNGFLFRPRFPPAASRSTAGR